MIAAETEAIRTYRSYIRELDLPTLKAQQSAIVDAAEQMVNGLFQFESSGFTDFTVNNYLIPFTDAHNDFDDVYGEFCFYDR